MGAHPPPKAEVRGSNPLGCANLFNNLAIYQKLLKALCSNCAPRGLKKWHQSGKEDTAGKWGSVTKTNIKIN